MKKYITFFLTHLPLLTLVVASGLLFRVAGIVDELATHRSYRFWEAPVYAPLLDGVAEAMGVGNAGTAPVTAKHDGQDAAESEAVANGAAESGDGTGELAEPPKPAEKAPGYESAETEAERLGKPLEKIIHKREKLSNGTYTYAEDFPEGSQRPVVPAMDYGVADPQYMDAFETTYDYPDKGIFAQDHDYYSFQPVEDGYFDNALFIGDSQTDGLYNYAGLREHADFYALESVTIYNLFDVRIPFRSPAGENESSLDEVLQARNYGKVYICVGMNELGMPDTTQFRHQYKRVLERIREAQPEAIIYVQGIIHISIWYSAGDPAFNNKNVVQRNEAISKLANGHDIFYLDPNERLCDGNGDLNLDYTNDGVHLKAQYYPLWQEYLKQYAIIRNGADR